MCISHLLRVLTVQVSTLLRLYLFLDPKLMTNVTGTNMRLLPSLAPTPPILMRDMMLVRKTKLKGHLAMTESPWVAHKQRPPTLSVLST